MKKNKELKRELEELIVADQTMVCQSPDICAMSHHSIRANILSDVYDYIVDLEKEVKKWKKKAKS